MKRHDHAAVDFEHKVIGDLPDPFDQSNVDGFKADAETRPIPPHTFGTRDMWATASRAERRAAKRATRKKGNK